MVVENARNFFVATMTDLINQVVDGATQVGVDALDFRKYLLAKSFKRGCSQLAKQFLI